MQRSGVFSIYVGAGGAGKRSEVAVALPTGTVPRGNVLRLPWIRLQAASGTEFEIKTAVTVAGFTTVACRHADGRLGVSPAWFGYKSSAAATAGGTSFLGETIRAGDAEEIQLPLGIILTDASRTPNDSTALIRVTADNLGFACTLGWEIVLDPNYAEGMTQDLAY